MDNTDVLVERIEGLKNLINQRFEENHAANFRIEEQVKKTNGRVSSLEGWRNKMAGALLVISGVIVPLFVQYLKSKL